MRTYVAIISIAEKNTKQAYQELARTLASMTMAVRFGSSHTPMSSSVLLRSPLALPEVHARLQPGLLPGDMLSVLQCELSQAVSTDAGLAAQLRQFLDASLF